MCHVEREKNSGREMHDVGMIEAEEDQYLVHTLPSFSVTFSKMGFSANSATSLPGATP